MIQVLKQVLKEVLAQILTELLPGSARAVPRSTRRLLLLLRHQPRRPALR